jgi:branched-subunit amino acid aminotransferase/4-amino-4-deoxychorismate lyase
MSLGMDDRDGFIWLDGKLVPWRDSRLHVLTHALHYGSAVFEGERIYDGRVFRLAAHSQRLINSARLLDYEIPSRAPRSRRRRAPWSRPTACRRAMSARSPGAARR